MRWHNRFTDMEALIRRIERGKVTWAEFMEKRGQTAPIA